MWIIGRKKLALLWRLLWLSIFYIFFVLGVIMVRIYHLCKNLARTRFGVLSLLLLSLLFSSFFVNTSIVKATSSADSVIQMLTTLNPIPLGPGTDGTGTCTDPHNTDVTNMVDYSWWRQTWNYQINYNGAVANTDSFITQWGDAVGAGGNQNAWAISLNGTELTYWLFPKTDKLNVTANGIQFWNSAGTGYDGSNTLRFNIFYNPNAGCRLQTYSAVGDPNATGSWYGSAPSVKTILINTDPSNYIFPVDYAGVLAPPRTTAPPVVYDAPLDWDFTARVNGLNVHFQANTVGKDPTAEFDWDFLGNSTFVNMNPTNAIATDASDTTTAIYSYTQPAGVKDGAGNVIPFVSTISSQYLDYTYATAGVYDIGLDTVSSHGVHKWTHLQCTVGSVGFCKSDARNGQLKALAGVTASTQKDCEALYPVTLTDFTKLGLNIGCQISNFFVPDFSTIYGQSLQLQAEFNAKAGVAAYALQLFPTLFGQLNASSPIDPGLGSASGCIVQFNQNTTGVHTFLSSPVQIDFCSFQRVAPSMFELVVMWIRGVTVFGLLIVLYYRILHFLSDRGNARSSVK